MNARFMIWLRMAVLLGVTCVLLACSSAPKVPPPQLPERLPVGSLPGAVNTEFDEIAPFLTSDGKYLYVTRDTIRVDTLRTGSDKVVRQQRIIIAHQSVGAWSRGVLAPPTGIVGDYNYGALATDSSLPFFFSAAHIPEQHGGIQPDSTQLMLRSSFGGADLFERIHIDSASVDVVQNLGDTINSPYWDAQPAVASNGPDSLLLVFSSERPVFHDSIVFAHGYSMPFQNQSYALSFPGDTIRQHHVVKRGNADLYYTFRIAGIWSPVRNLNDALGLHDSVNTPFNEYSPFIFCPHIRPVLYFSSQGHQAISDSSANGNIYSVCLEIDYHHRTLRLSNWQDFPHGSDAINADSSDERFPFVRAEAGENYLYFSSNRDSKGTRIDSSQRSHPFRIKARGGYDLYRMQLPKQSVCECKAPKMTYRVVLVNHAKPNDSIREPILRIVDQTTGRVDSIRGTHLEVNMSPSHIYKAVGGSSLHHTCETPGKQTLARYIGYDKTTRVTCRSVTDTVMRKTYFSPKITADTLSYDSAISYSIIQETQHVNTARLHNSARSLVTGLTYDQCFEIPKPDTHSAVSSIHFDSNRVNLVTRIQKIRFDTTAARIDSVPIQVHRLLSDTTIVIDTVNMTATKLGRSVLNITDNSPVFHLWSLDQPDSVVNDTVFLEPVYNYVCKPTQNVSNLNLFGIPYFQTCFWHVNTVQELNDVLAQMRSESAWTSNDRRFVELHPYNQYWGRNDSLLRDKRIAMFKYFARRVDATFDSLATVVDKSLQDFLEHISTLPPTEAAKRKFVIDLTAWSDKRKILRAHYFEPSIQYVGDYTLNNSGSRCVAEKLKLVKVAMNEDLSGTDNVKLSNLRAYYSYRDFLARLQKKRNFNTVMARGKVALPDSARTPSEFLRWIDSASVVMLIRGQSIDIRQKDTTISSEHDNLKFSIKSTIKTLKFTGAGGAAPRNAVDTALSLDFNRWDSLVVHSYVFDHGCFTTEPPCSCQEELKWNGPRFDLTKEQPKSIGNTVTVPIVMHDDKKRK